MNNISNIYICQEIFFIWHDLSLYDKISSKHYESCKTLRDYSEYTSRVRQYAKTIPLSEAVDRAIKECIDNDILAEFLSRNRAEARNVSIYEYDEEKHMRQVKAEGILEGEDRFAVLTQKLLTDFRTEDLQRAVTDKEFRAVLYKEYEIQ